MPRQSQGTLFYSPDISAYISPAGSSDIIDISKDVHSFTVDRQRNAVSKASLNINNKFAKYDRVIGRMSRLVIFLKRMSWVQVFAGYVTQAPYLSVLPGAATISASCTLKRVQHTFWDPYSLEAGNLFPGGTQTDVTKMQDGGAAWSLLRILTKVGGWDPEQVLIQKIPQKFMVRAAELAAKAKDDIDPRVLKMLDLILDATGSFGSGGGGTNSAATLAGSDKTPFEVAPVDNVKGFHYSDDWHAPRTGHLHVGIDLMAPLGTPIRAPFDGVVSGTRDDGNTAGERVYVIRDGDGGRSGIVANFHLVPGSAKLSGRVKAGDLIGKVGSSGNASAGAEHDHLQWHPGATSMGTWTNDESSAGGPVRPFPYIEAAYKGTKVQDDGGGGKDLSVFGGIENYLPSQLDPLSDMLTGRRAVLNDESLMTTVSYLCRASLRSFQSGPTGDFIAWYEDPFGLWGQTPALQLRDIEIRNFRIDISDENLVTHLMVAGDTEPTSAGSFVEGVNVDLDDWIHSAGLVTVEHAQIMKLLMGLDPDKKYRNLPGAWMMKRFGVRPKMESIPQIRDYRWEFMYALKVFMEHWSAQYSTSVDFTFMPELYPGMRVELPDHNIALYCTGVTHSGSRDGGFTTTARLDSPMARGKNGKWVMLPLEEEPREMPEEVENVEFVPGPGGRQ